jgi:OPA family sugar phosphate sensor protein UhpC-like MFS transporter
VLWALNGWFQSMGAAPVGVALTHWFAGPRARHSLRHLVHEPLDWRGFSFFVTAVAGERLGLARWILDARARSACSRRSVLFRTLHDRPETEGLPPVEVYKGGGAVAAPRAERTVRGIWREQLQGPCASVGLGDRAVLGAHVRLAVRHRRLGESSS